MGVRKRSIVIDPRGLRRTLNEAIRGFCRDVLVAKKLIHPDVLEDAELAAERDRIVDTVARRWQDWEADFEPEDPMSAQSLLESGALTPAIVDAINRFCKVLTANGYMTADDCASHRLDAQKYSIARRLSRGWVSEARAE